MDTSPEYVKMCEKTREIQSQYIAAEGDYFADVTNGGIKVLGLGHVFENVQLNIRREDVSIQEYVWLPRQDQLQQLYGAHEESFSLFCHYGWRVSEAYDTTCGEPDGDLPNKYLKGFKSFEQLWLAIFMARKFQKRWTGEDWVKA